MVFRGSDSDGKVGAARELERSALRIRQRRQRRQ